MRKLVVPLALALAGAQLGAGPAVLASAFTLGLHGHAHSVSVVAEDGHLDLVISHGERAEHEHGPASHHEEPRSAFSEGDHVVHLDSANDATLRRATFDSAPALAVAVAALPALAPRPHLVLPPEPRARGVDHLRTVVLRL